MRTLLQDLRYAIRDPPGNASGAHRHHHWTRGRVCGLPRYGELAFWNQRGRLAYLCRSLYAAGFGCTGRLLPSCAKGSAV